MIEISGRGKILLFFFFSKAFHSGCGTHHTPSYSVGTAGFFLGSNVSEA
jgi:hypothetical protein